MYNNELQCEQGVIGREVGEQERWVGGLTVTNSSERHAKPAAVMGKEQRRTGGIL